MSDRQDDHSNEARLADDPGLLIADTRRLLEGALRTIDESEAVLRKVAQQRGESRPRADIG
jgi:hypothetical protein